MGFVVGCVFGGFGTDGSGFVRGFGLGSGGGDGEWSGVIGVVGILSDNTRLSTSGGESSRSSENKLSITLLIVAMSAWLSSSIPSTGSLASGGWGLSGGIIDVVQLVAISEDVSGFLTKFDLMVAIVLGFCGIWPSCCARSWLIVLDLNREHLVEIFWVNVNSSVSFSMNAWKSPS